MRFDLEPSIEILERTPRTLDTLLRDLADDWIRGNEGGESWSPYDVVGHLVHGERADWMPRARRLLEHGESRAFEPFDRFAQFEESKGKPMSQLLDEFASLRAANLVALRDLGLGPRDWPRTGRHPSFGTVTLSQLLATWVVHDLGHVGQIVRVMAKQYAGEVGPWQVYLPVLAPRSSDR
jgi:hypothetical protein